MMNKKVKMDWTKKMYPIIGYALCCLLACKEKANTTKPKETAPPVVDVFITDMQPLSNIVEANGTVNANEFVELRPEVSGRLTFLNIPEGKNVAAGTVLARVNSADLLAQQQKSKVQLDLAEKTVNRLKQLLDVNGVNQADYDIAVNQVNSLKADIAYMQALIEKTIIRAPFSGTVGLRQVSPGAYVGPATIIASIQQLGKSKIDFTLPEEYSSLIKVGNRVAIQLTDAVSDKQKATIIAVEPQANASTRNIVVRATLDAAKANPGAFVKVFINSENRQAILVPTNVIIPGDVSNQIVLVKNGKASFVSVETGKRLEKYVAITKGLLPGDTVVATGVLFARPNSILKIRAIKTLKDLE